MYIFQTFCFVFASEHSNDYTLRETRYQLVHKSRRIFGREDDRSQPVTETSTKEPRSPTAEQVEMYTDVYISVHTVVEKTTGVVRPSTVRFQHSQRDSTSVTYSNHQCDST